MIGWKIRAILLRHESCFGTALRRMHNRQPRGVVLHAQEAFISLRSAKTDDGFNAVVSDQQISSIGV